MHYSNPNISFNGTATGTTTDNNARTIRNTSCDLANHYQAGTYMSLSLWAPSTVCANAGSFDAFATIYEAPSTLPGHPPYTYNWSVSGCGSSFVQGAISSTIVVSLGCPSGGVRIDLTVTSSDGVTVMASRIVQVTSDCGNEPLIIDPNQQLRAETIQAQEERYKQQIKTMKNIIVVILLICLAGLSCSKEDVLPIYEPGQMTFGWAKGFKNGKAFTASGEAKKRSGGQYFALKFNTFTPEGFHRELILLTPISYSVKEYTVSRTAGIVGEEIVDGIARGGYVTSQDDGDVGEDSYVVADHTGNRIVFTEIDTIKNIAKGSFSVKYKLSPNWPKSNPDNPDVVYFTDVEFEVSFR